MPEEPQGFKFETKRNVIPPLEVTVDNGFVQSTNAMAALKEVVGSYARPSRVFSAEIMAPTSERQVLARFLSARAATQEAAPSGEATWKEDGLYVDGKKVPERPEVYELVQR